MQLFKHMEVVLMLAFGIVCAAALRPADATDTAHAAAAAVASSAQADAAMPVVHVIGRRLTHGEKHGSDAPSGD
jgi:hypothetical protein